MRSPFSRALVAAATSVVVVSGLFALTLRAHAVVTTAAVERQAPSGDATSALTHDSAERASEATAEPAALATSTPAPPSAPPSPAQAPVAAQVRRVARPASSHVARAQPTATPMPRRSWLLSDDGSVNTGVGIYSDCTGEAPVPRGNADIDVCIGDVTYYFVGHHPGVFSGLVGMPVGAGITYWDGAGVAHHYRVIARRVIESSAGAPSPVGGVEFQTCVDSAGVQDYILDAVAG